MEESNTEDSLAVLKLKVTSETIKKVKHENDSFEAQFLNYTPELDIPDPHNSFNGAFGTNFASLNEETDQIISGNTTIHTEEKLPSNVVKVLKEFNPSWPTSTPIACYWCCQPFKTFPLGLPIRYTNNQFFLQGCFCSLECTTAYNFQTTSSDTVWDRYALINLLAKKLGYNYFVQSAPPRESLEMFGGSMKIEEFREYHTVGKKKILLHQFPMVAAQQQMEEMYESNPANGTCIEEKIGFQSNHLSKLEQKLKLSFPKARKRGNLDKAMNITHIPVEV